MSNLAGVKYAENTVIKKVKTEVGKNNTQREN